MTVVTFAIQAEADFEYAMMRSRSDAVFFTLSHLSLKTSSKKARRKSRPYRDPDYEPRIQAALAGVNEKKDMRLVAAALREDVSIFCTFIFFICQQIVI